MLCRCYLYRAKKWWVDRTHKTFAIDASLRFIHPLLNNVQTVVNVAHTGP